TVLSSCIYIHLSFFFSRPAAPRDLLSFPTRRSSDLVGGGDHDDGTLHPFGPELVFDHLPHLAAPFADEGEDDDVGGGAPSHHPHERRLADAGPADETHPLALSERAEQIDQTHTHREDLIDPLAGERRRDLAFHADDLAGRLGASVERVAEGVDHPADEALADDRAPATAPHLDPVAAADALGAAEHHRPGGITGDGDHLAGPAPAGRVDGDG